MTRPRSRPLFLPSLLVLAMPVAGPLCQSRKDAAAERLAETYAAFARIASAQVREAGAETSVLTRRDFGTEIVALRKLVAKCDKLDFTFSQCLELAVVDRVLAIHADPKGKRVTKTLCDSIAEQVIAEINYPNAPGPTWLSASLHHADRYRAPEAVSELRREKLTEIWRERLEGICAQCASSEIEPDPPFGVEVVSGQGLTLTNVCGRELTRLTMKLTSRMGAAVGQEEVAYLFLDRWKPEQAFVMPEELSAGVSGLAELDHPGVTISAWCAEFAHGPTAFSVDEDRYAGLRRTRPARFRLDLHPERTAGQPSEADEMVGAAEPADAAATEADEPGPEPELAPLASDADLQLVMVAQQLGNHSDAVRSLTDLRGRHSEDAAVLLLLGEALGSYGSRQSFGTAQSLLQEVQEMLSQSPDLADETLERLEDAGFKIPRDVPGLLVRIGRDLQALAKHESLEWFIDRQKLENRLGQIGRDIEREQKEFEERRDEQAKFREDLKEAEAALQREIERQRRRVGIKDVGDERTRVGTCRRKLSQAEARVARTEEELRVLFEEKRALEALAARLDNR